MNICILVTGRTVPNSFERERSQLDTDGRRHARIRRRRRQQQLVRVPFSSNNSNPSFIYLFIYLFVGWFVNDVAQLATDRRLHRIQVRRVPECGIAGPTPAHTRQPGPRLSLLHPTVRPRSQAARCRIHETVARQSQYHPHLGQGRHHDARRMHLFQKTGSLFFFCSPPPTARQLRKKECRSLPEYN